jgi:hypothetical protein
VDEESLPDASELVAQELFEEATVFGGVQETGSSGSRLSG